jgi:hypothetical protein
VVSHLIQTQFALAEQSRREEEEQRKRSGSIERLQLMRAAEEHREREKYARERF